MGRPTKEQVKRRKAIEGLGLFVRDSEIYTSFEYGIEKANLTPTKVSYLFCDECSKRNEDYLSFDNNQDISMNKYHFKSFPIIEPLLNIDYELGLYLFHLHHWKYIDRSNDKILFPPYYSCTLAYKKDIEKALERDLNLDLAKAMMRFSSKFTKASISKVELEEWIEHYKTDDDLIDIDFLQDDFFTEDDRKKIKEYYKNLNYKDYHHLNYLTLITKEFPQSPKDGLERNIFAELDLTKPLEELVEFVTMLKKDYDKDPTSISNFHRLIGMELKDHKCSLDACEIYKHKNPKPLSGRLMDVLFIYDCGVAGLDDSYIMGEINRYWHDVKNIHREEITKDTLQKYRKFAKDYIDNQEYKNFIRGYVLPIQ